MAAGTFFVSLRLADRLFLAYNAVVVLLVLVTYARQPLAPWILAVHCGLVAAALLLIRIDSGRGLTRVLRVWYPALAFVWVYMEAGLLRHGLFPEDLDPLLLRAELLVFGIELYRELPPLLGTLGLEVIHFFYFTYYVLLYVPGLLAMPYKPRLVREYVFTISLCMFSLCLFFMLFPSDGPKQYRAHPVYDGYLFIPLMNLIYGNVDQGGGAFPSAHSSQAVLVALFARLFFPAWRYLFYFLAVMILVSTILCSYHYAIDTAAGAALGFAFYWLGRRLYRAYGADDEA